MYIFKDPYEQGSDPEAEAFLTASVLGELAGQDSPDWFWRCVGHFGFYGTHSPFCAHPTDHDLIQAGVLLDVEKLKLTEKHLRRFFLNAAKLPMNDFDRLIKFDGADDLDDLVSAIVHLKNDYREILLLALCGKLRSCSVALERAVIEAERDFDIRVTVSQIFRYHLMLSALNSARDARTRLMNPAGRSALAEQTGKRLASLKSEAVCLEEHADKVARFLDADDSEKVQDGECFHYYGTKRVGLVEECERIAKNIIASKGASAQSFINRILAIAKTSADNYKSLASFAISQDRKNKTLSAWRGDDPYATLYQAGAFSLQWIAQDGSYPSKIDKFMAVINNPNGSIELPSFGRANLDTRSLFGLLRAVATRDVKAGSEFESGVGEAFYAMWNEEMAKSKKVERFESSCVDHAKKRYDVIARSDFGQMAELQGLFGLRLQL